MLTSELDGIKHSIKKTKGQIMTETESVDA